MTLDPGSAAFLEGMKASGGKPMYEMAVGEARAAISGASAQLAASLADVARVDDRRVPVSGGDIGIRIYTPRTTGGKLPIVLQFHGGGWVAGDLDTHDSIARYYAAHANAIVISVDYRRPPEHRFPIAVDDSFASVEWVAAHADELGGDASRLAVSGDSAGGNLAAVICQLAKQRGGPRIAYQALIYPVVDVRDPVITPLYESRAEFGGGEYFLSTRDMLWFRGHYLTDPAREAQDPRASPMAAADLSGLPPALVVTAGCDPLRDEAKVYADRLTASGVPVEYRCFEGAIHACMSFAGAIPQGLDALSFVAARLKENLSKVQVQ
ncbi:MAG TPA: alpha/beta hydrolase [Vicinamibacterales bacterium]|nr:alpha/beta hydrolase [Vicinamibacterales bacterium]